MAELLHSLGVFQTKAPWREQHGLDTKYFHTYRKDRVKKFVHLTTKMLTPYFYLQSFYNALSPFSQTYPVVVIPKPRLSFFSSTVNFSISGIGVSSGILSMVRAGRDGVVIRIGAAPTGWGCVTTPTTRFASGCNMISENNNMQPHHFTQGRYVIVVIIRN